LSVRTLLIVSVACVTFGQTYTISTIAAGAQPINIPGTAAALSPGDIATDAAGNLFLVNRNTILRLDASTGILTLIAGNGSTGASGDGGPAAGAQLYSPAGLALDSAGDLYIADAGNNRIRKVTGGVITTVLANGLSNPQAIALDPAGNLFIADTGNQRICKFAGGVLVTVAGNGTTGFGGDSGPAISASLNSPYGLAIDSSGNLYIADTENQRIRKVTNGVITTIAGNGTPGFSGDGGPATSAQFATPLGLAVDPTGSLYVADRDNSRVRKVANGVITTAASSAQPVSVALDAVDNLYVSGASSGQIGKVTNGVIATVAGGGTPSGLSAPSGVAVDSAGNLYVTDPVNNAVWKISGGSIASLASASAQWNHPSAVAVDSAGNVYIADSGNSRIRKATAEVITTVAGNGTNGFSGDGGPATSAQLNGPLGIAVDSAGNLYIADSNNYRVRKVAGGIITTVAGSGTPGLSCNGGPATAANLYEPFGVAVDSTGNLYISDFLDGCVRKVSNGVITTPVAGNLLQGYGGDNGPATSSGLFGPAGIALDSAGNLFIADSDNQRIRKVSGGVITTIAGNGTQGFSGDGGPAFNAQLNTPSGVAVDSSGNVYVADIGNNRIRLLTPAASPSINVGGIVNSATTRLGVAAGSIASVYGNFLVNSSSTASGLPLPTRLGGVTLLAGIGLSAPLFAVVPHQVNFQIPWELAGQSEVQLSTMVDGQISTAQTLLLAPFAPGIFSTNGQGSGQGAVLDTSYHLVDSSNPASAGSTVVQIYCTGLGGVTNQPPSGSAPANDQLSETTATPIVTVGGVPAQVLFSGLAPGTVGEYQVNVLVPAGSPKSSAVPVVIAFGDSVLPNGSHIGGVVSNTVTIAVQ